MSVRLMVISLAKHKDWKQEGTASLPLSKDSFYLANQACCFPLFPVIVPD